MFPFMQPPGRFLPNPKEALVGLAFLLILAALSGQSSAEIAWSDLSLDEAVASAARSRTLVFLVFGAEWCGFCRELERRTLSSAVVEQALKPYVSLRFDVDTEAGAKAAHRYTVTGLPTVLILDPDGNVSARSSGFMKDEELAALLDRSRLSSTSVSVGSLYEKAQAPDAGAELMVSVGMALIDRGREEDGRGLLERAALTGERGSPAVSRALLSLSSIALRRSGAEAALPLLTRAAQEAIDPMLLREAYTSLISLLRDLHRKQEQLQTWDQFASRLPDDETVQEDYARALLELGAAAERGLEAAQRAAGLDPAAGGPQECRAAALYRLGQYEEALEAVNESIILAPSETSPRILRLRIMEKLRAAKPQHPTTKHPASE